MLCQRIDEEERVILYISRTLQENERKWTVREKEALGIIWACEQFRPYIIGSKFTVETDHESLKWLLESKSPARLVRWALRLSEFNFDIKHRKGTNNSNADGLSRLPQPESEDIKDIEPFLLPLKVSDPDFTIDQNLTI